MPPTPLTQTIDLGTIENESEVFGVTPPPQIVDLAEIPAPLQHVYGVATEGGFTDVNLGEIPDDSVVYTPLVIARPPVSYRRIQLDGGGRLLLHAQVGDHNVEWFFELWKNGRPFKLVGSPNPVFTWKKPNGQTGTSTSRVIDRNRGRVVVRFETPEMVGMWRVQMKYVEHLNVDILAPPPPDSPFEEAPPPPNGVQLWKQLPVALYLNVTEGLW